MIVALDRRFDITVEGMPTDLTSAFFEDVADQINTGRLDNQVNTADFSILLFNMVFLVDSSSGNITVTLPSAADVTDQNVTIKKTDAVNIVTISGSETIDGSASFVLSSQESVVLYSTGSEFFSIG